MLSKQQEKEVSKITWDLSDLYDSLESPDLKKGLEKAEQDATKIQDRYKGKIKSLDAADLLKVYQAIESVWELYSRASQYIHLRYAIETDNDPIKSWVDTCDQVGTAIGNALVFFELEIGAVPKATYTTWRQSPVLENYHYSLEHSHKTARYNLSEKEEQLSALKNLTGIDAFQKLYEEFTSSFAYQFKINGKEETLTGDSLRALRTHKDKEVRRRAMKTFYKKYEENQLIFTHIYNNILKSKSQEKTSRGYKSTINIKNIHNDLSDEVIELLHDVTKSSYPLVQRYYTLKKRIINCPDMTLADIYAPMPQTDQTYAYSEAKDIVLDGFNRFDSEIYDMAKAMFDENRIHAPVLPKKRGGAFCSGAIPSIKPYVMLNYLGRPRDIATIAHELGHAIHDMLAAKQTLTNFHPILPLAETASVFAEMLVTDKLLADTQDPLTKQSILSEKIEDIFATSHRQNIFSTFEMATHQKAETQLLTTNDLCETYQSQLKDMFGNVVKQPEEYKWEWSTIPHIFESPFYVYSYNFGNLFVMALYQQYLEEGTAFIPKYKALLSEGSAQSPEDIMKIMGCDPKDPVFWNKSITYISSLIDRLEESLESA